MAIESVYDKMSKAETKVSEFLKENKIWWQFESPVFVLDDKNRPRVWSPDFYLTELGIYLEVVGNSKWNYEYREEIYKKNKIPIIFIQPSFWKDWEGDLLKKIDAIHKRRWEIIKKLS